MKSMPYKTLRAHFPRLILRSTSTEKERKRDAMDTVLVLEDNERLAASLKQGLELANFQITVSPTLADARRQLATKNFALYLFDVNLPDGSGFELCAELRQKGDLTPLIFLTAQVSEESAVEGLSLGAKDFIRKPFSIRELIARMRAQLGRAGKAGKQSEYGGVVIDFAEHRAKYAEKEIALTPREFEIFSRLIQHGGNLIEREAFLQEIDAEGNLSAQTLNTVISRIRVKLEKSGVNGIEIQSEYGLGYRLVKKAS